MVAFTGVLIAVGLVVFVFGAARVSNEVVYDDQALGINLAILGAVLANAGAASLLLAGRRAVSGRRVAVLGPLPQIVRRDASVPIEPALTENKFVGADDLRHFHRESCPLAADRDWTAHSRREHEQAGRTPCGVCLP